MGDFSSHSKAAALLCERFTGIYVGNGTMKCEGRMTCKDSPPARDLVCVMAVKNVKRGVDIH